jgi:4a-hydroxytetrahydrobiopterin dehydratase
LFSGRAHGKVDIMTRPAKLEKAAVDAWLASHAAWERAGEGAGPAAIARRFKFKDFSAALGFVVRVGLVAEKRDHHPDVELGWGKARLLWSTHDAGGITQLDLELAEASDAIAKEMGG